MTPFLMQVLVLGGLISTSITDGFIFGQMSGMLDAIMKSDSELRFTDNELSWIASAIFISSFIGTILTACITDLIGRKLTTILFTSPILLNWIMLYYAKDFAVIILSRVIVGICFGGAFLILTIATAEYTSPKYRGLSISIVMSVGPAFGTGIGHVLSTIINWRYVALIGIVPTLFAVFLPLFWVESPSWLASKGKFDECEKAFRALHGTGISSEKELALLVKLEKYKQSQNGLINEAKRTRLSDAIRQRRFWNVIALSTAISVFLAASGRSYLPVFTITIIGNITNSSDIVLYTFLLEIFIICGTVLSIIFRKMFNTRPLLFLAGLLSCVVLLLLSASIYFKPGDISYMSWVNVLLLSLYLVFINCGPYPIVLGMLGEMFPLDLKTYCFIISSTICGIFFFLSVKMASWVFSVIGYHGGFLISVFGMIVCLFIFGMKFPETKGRTLQEIELFFQNNTFKNIDHLLSEQSEPLKV